MSHRTITVKESLNTEAALKAKEYNEKMKIDAENRILIKFPERIVFLNELLKKPEFNICSEDVDFTLEVPPMLKTEMFSKDFDGKNADKKQHAVDDLPVPVPESLIMPTNQHIFELIKIQKPILKQLIQDVNTLKIWVSLLIPKIEDGNNFGVAIQEDTISEIRYAESEATRYLEQLTRYYGYRAQLTTKVVKYPYSVDYRRCIEELDEKQRMIMSLHMHEIRNRYSTLHDIVIKNFEKIIKPRTSNVESLY